ncbi:MAG: hypothetical protein LAT82_04450 [Nanoarchaeota archaeon]|nr:hypothetical protein [Nanoarchaeota archaeon]
MEHKKEPLQIHKKQETIKKDNKPTSLRNKIRKAIFIGIMRYSLLVGLVFGIIVILLGIFEPLFLPANLFLIMMGTIYTIFNFKNREELFKEFIAMLGTIVFVALLLTYITNTVQYTPVSMEGVQTMFRNLQYMLSVFVSLFAIPCMYASFRLLFLPKKE